MFKEALEDIQRFQADREVNRRGVLVYSAPSNAWVRKQWRDILVRPPVEKPALRMHASSALMLCAHSRKVQRVVAFCVKCGTLLYSNREVSSGIRAWCICM